MTAPNLNEVYNFVNKFLNLRKNGENATLSLHSENGSVSVNLHLHLSSYPPPHCEPHPPPWPRARSRPSPSRRRRSTRRADARARAEKADDDALSPAEHVNDNSSFMENRDAVDKAENASQVHTQQTPADQAATHHQVIDAEEAFRQKRYY